MTVFFVQVVHPNPEEITGEGGTTVDVATGRVSADNQGCVW